MLVGALFVALTVAPTDEMPLIGYLIRNQHAIATVVLSLGVLHFFMQGVGFSGHASAEDHGAASVFLRLVVVGYALALATSAFLLWVFGRYEGASVQSALRMTIVLALPATLGAAAARITLDTQ
jgi:putative integral membrane protein (TIGR02587 family)